MLRNLLLTCVCITFALAAPPKKPPPELLDQYTLNGTIPVLEWYWNNTQDSNAPSTVFTTSQINKFISEAKNRKRNYYGRTDAYLYNALDKYSEHIREKKVAIMGSTIPWYESIILAYEGFPVTIEYNKIINHEPKIETFTVEEFKKNPRKFDAVVSISSFEHDGLGRYGDPLDPNGDLKAMESVKDMLTEDGLLFLSVPVGRDTLVWNAHRIYGNIRLPMLLKGWKVLDTFGFSQRDFTIRLTKHVVKQPVFVLQKISL